MIYYKIGLYAGIVSLVVGLVLCLFGQPSAGAFLLSFPAGMGGSWCASALKEIRAVESLNGDS